MKNWFKRITGIAKIEAEKDRLEQERIEALARTAEAQAKEELAKMTPKDRATKKGEAWVGVLDTKVNRENPRNGFFELDWNALFIVELKKAGYGFDGDPEEEIVDRWFRDIVRNMLSEEGMDTSRSSGFININKITKNQSEAS